MELLRMYVCVCIYLATQVYGRPMGEQDMCWRLRGTSFKLCVEEDVDDIITKRNPVTVFRQIFSYPPYVGKGAIIDDDRDFAYSGKKDSSDKTFINKRPFDSISYNTGLGGFK